MNTLLSISRNLIFWFTDIRIFSYNFYPCWTCNIFLKTLWKLYIFLIVEYLYCTFHIAPLPSSSILQAILSKNYSRYVCDNQICILLKLVEMIMHILGHFHNISCFQPVALLEFDNAFHNLKPRSQRSLNIPSRIDQMCARTDQCNGMLRNVVYCCNIPALVWYIK